MQETQATWTLGNNPPWHLGLISGRLTQNADTLTPGLVREINDALDKYLGSPQGLRHPPRNVFVYGMLICSQTSLLLLSTMWCRRSSPKLSVMHLLDIRCVGKTCLA